MTSLHKLIAIVAMWLTITVVYFDSADESVGLAVLVAGYITYVLVSGKGDSLRNDAAAESGAE